MVVASVDASPVIVADVRMDLTKVVSGPIVINDGLRGVIR